ncbi:restriction endonuclease subunit S [Paraburkholderia sp. 22098]|uniref:restriction endonuclease subunit S n=1 Tax=Paraburkholderia sp. 22098 TaxID=3453874 RepID=UPI003F839BC6
MPSEWPIVRVADCCELIVDCVNKTAPVVEYETPYRMIRTTNVRNGFIELSDCRFVDEATFRTWTRRAPLLDGDVILTREAPIGEVGLVRGNQTIFLGQRLMQYRANRAALDPRFLCYAFLSPQLQHQFGAHEGSGSVVSHIRVGDCSDFKIPLPSLPEQRVIADLLSAIDERRLLLLQTNATLEAIAQAVFKSWFIDFDPVRAKAEGREPEGMDTETAALFPAEFEESALGAIPKGWNCVRLGDLLELSYGKALKSTERRDGPIPVYGSGGVTGFHDEPLVQGGSIIVGRKGTVGSLYWEDGPFYAIDTTFYVRPKGVPLTYCYYAMQRLGLETMNTDAAVPGLNRENAYRINLARPSAAALHSFDDVVVEVRRSMRRNAEQARTLTAIRDSLLPRLISGKLRLPEAQAQLGEVIA